jgi:hypothetical protein
VLVIACITFGVVCFARQHRIRDIDPNKELSVRNEASTPPQPSVVDAAPPAATAPVTSAYVCATCQKSYDNAEDLAQHAALRHK